MTRGGGDRLRGLVTASFGHKANTALSVEAARLLVVLVPHLHVRNVAEPNQRACHACTDHDVAKLLGGRAPIGHAHEQLSSRRLNFATGKLDRCGADLCSDAIERPSRTFRASAARPRSIAPAEARLRGLLARCRAGRAAGSERLRRPHGALRGEPSPERMRLMTFWSPPASETTGSSASVGNDRIRSTAFLASARARSASSPS